MLQFLLFFTILMNVATGFDVNSIFPRQNCYAMDQEGCCENGMCDDFLTHHPELSRSATNLTVADTWFWLFTPCNKDKPEQLHKCGGKLPPNSNFDPKLKLIVVIHTFIVGICDLSMFREWKEEFLARGDCNVLFVDYTWGDRFDYPTAILNIHIVAKQAKIVIRNIMKQTSFKKEDIWIVGESLGAHACGILGCLLGKVGRIIGLDPSGPGFGDKTPKKDKLDKTDAELVEIWHTNMGCLPSFGTRFDDGHVNFYINGGSVQTSCYEYSLTSILKGDVIYGLGTLLYKGICYHAQALVYFKVSINPGNCQFVGVKCSSYDHFEKGLCKNCGKSGSRCTIMGFNTDHAYNKTGKMPCGRYYVSTTLDCPYCNNTNIQLNGFTATYNSLLQPPNRENDSQSRVCKN